MGSTVMRLHRLVAWNPEPGTGGTSLELSTKMVLIEQVLHSTRQHALDSEKLHEIDKPTYHCANECIVFLLQMQLTQNYCKK
ncbi:hypothetical protein MUK42_19946 [Musa troglodytarum]|uniref:Uncharacterized protein n=1 Tax=Musa troglodytarum TaxID=320322 RepID=A0A9E7F2S7_9LILI|nr:hypothetical protein MUK42_19946 [Musa troglodytarum]